MPDFVAEFENLKTEFYKKAPDMLEQAVLQMVDKVFLDNPDIEYFVSAMGSCFFVTFDDHNLDMNIDIVFPDLDKFLNDNIELGSLDLGIKYYRDGSKITDW